LGCFNLAFWLIDWSKLFWFHLIVIAAVAYVLLILAVKRCWNFVGFLEFSQLYVLIVELFFISP